MAESAGDLFRVVTFLRVLEQLRRWDREAIRLGIRQEYLEALKAINDKLTHEPTVWGDPQHRLHALDLLMYRGFHAIFYVWYAVDAVNRVVYVREFLPRPGHPLGRDG